MLVVSAHWFINATAVTAMPRPRTIHDFYGFPDELFAVRLPGARATRSWPAEVAELVSPDVGRCSTTTAGASTTARGPCSSTSSRTADVPVVQLSINAELSRSQYHVELGAALAPLRDSRRD